MLYINLLGKKIEELKERVDELEAENKKKGIKDV